MDYLKRRSKGLQSHPSLNMLPLGFGCKSVRERKAETAFQAVVEPILPMPANQICKARPPERAYSQVTDENPSQREYPDVGLLSSTPCHRRRHLVQYEMRRPFQTKSGSSQHEMRIASRFPVETIYGTHKDCCCRLY